MPTMSPQMSVLLFDFFLQSVSFSTDLHKHHLFYFLAEKAFSWLHAIEYVSLVFCKIGIKSWMGEKNLLVGLKRLIWCGYSACTLSYSSEENLHKNLVTSYGLSWS